MESICAETESNSLHNHWHAATMIRSDRNHTCIDSLQHSGMAITNIQYVIISETLAAATEENVFSHSRLRSGFSTAN